MGVITDEFVETFRDFVTDGVASSGLHEPTKTEIRTLGALIEAGIANVALGALVDVVYATRAELDADLAHAADSVALVYADATDANNDLYVKTGASGAGGWTLTAALHDIIESLAGSYSSLAQVWAEGTEPGGVGTKSAKEYSEDIAATAAAIAATAAEVTALSAAAAITDVLTIRALEGRLPRGKYGDLPTLHIGWQDGLFYRNGTFYASADDLYAAMTGVTQRFGERKVTIGPIRAGNEMLAGSAFDIQADVDAWTGSANATLSLVGTSLRVVGNNGAPAYAYQAVATEIGQRYSVEAFDTSAGPQSGYVSVGTTPAGVDIVSQQTLPDDAAGAYTFIATTETTYVNLYSHIDGDVRDYGYASLKTSIPFEGFDLNTGTLIAQYLAPSGAAAAPYVFALMPYIIPVGFNAPSLAWSHNNGSRTGVLVNYNNDTGINSLDAFLPSQEGSALRGKANTLAAVFAENRLEMTLNGELVKGDYATARPTVDRLWIGVSHDGGAYVEQDVTPLAYTYFNRVEEEISHNTDWFTKNPDTDHSVGDSFVNHAFRAEYQLQSGREVSMDGVGGSSIAEQALRFSRTPALHHRTLIIMDGGLSDHYDGEVGAEIARIIDRLPHRRFVYVQPSPSDLALGTQARADWDAAQETILNLVTADHYIETLTALQAGGDGSANDNADIANGLVPRSLRDPGDIIHENAAGTTIRVGEIEAHMAARPWLRLTPS